MTVPTTKDKFPLMTTQLGRCASLLAIFCTLLLTAVCAPTAESRSELRGVGADELAAQPPTARPAALTGFSPNPAGADDHAQEPADAPSAPRRFVAPSDRDQAGPDYIIAFKFKADEPLYYTIENEFREGGGVPPLLTYSTSIKERRFVTQRVLAPASQPGPSPTDFEDPVALGWECDRYEALERGMKEDVSFDSLRDAYPPSPLRGLGNIPGSVASFWIEPSTGRAANVSLQPGQTAGPTVPGRPTKTAERCRLSTENLQSLLNDIGPLFIPDSAKRIGDTWTRSLQEEHKPFGIVTTELRCSLASVREENGRAIGTIDLMGEMTFQPDQPPAHLTSGAAPSSAPSTAPTTTTATTATRPARRPGATASKSRDYKLEKKEFSGRVQFDLTNGRIVEMTLHRAIEFVADLEAESPTPMATQIRSDSSHDLRVKVSDKPTPKPIIVGGPKPPVEPVEARPAQTRTPPATRPTTRPATASRPATRPTTRPAMQSGRSTTQRSLVRPVPLSPTTRPGPHPTGIPTSRPASTMRVPPRATQPTTMPTWAEIDHGWPLETEEPRGDVAPREPSKPQARRMPTNPGSTQPTAPASRSTRRPSKRALPTTSPATLMGRTPTSGK